MLKTTTGQSGLRYELSLNSQKRDFEIRELNLKVGVSTTFHFTEDIINDDTLYRSRTLIKDSPEFEAEYAKRENADFVLPLATSFKEWELVNEGDSLTDPNLLILVYRFKNYTVLTRNSSKSYYGSCSLRSEWNREREQLLLDNQKEEKFPNGYSAKSGRKQRSSKKLRSFSVNLIYSPVINIPFPEKRFEIETRYASKGESVVDKKSGIIKYRYIQRDPFFSLHVDSEDRMDEIEEFHRSFETKITIFS